MMRMRAGFVTEPVLLSLPGAKLSMCTISSLVRQIPRKGSRRGLNGLANVVDDALHHCGIVSLRHHPNQGFGAGFADDEAAPALQLGFGGGDAPANAVGV